MIAHLLKQNNIDIICIQETWLNPNIGNNELLFDNFKYHRLDRSNNKKGGGLLILIKNIFDSYLENSLINNNIELIHISFKIGFLKTVQLVNIYRPPSSKLEDFRNDLEYFLNNINYSTLPLIVVGDFNYSLKNCKKTDKFLRFLSIYGLCPVVIGDTRVTSRCSSDIDWLIVNDLAFDKCSNIICTKFCFTDHNFIQFSYKSKKKLLIKL